MKCIRKSTLAFGIILICSMLFQGCSKSQSSESAVTNNNLNKNNWEISTPEEQGMDSNLLKKSEANIIKDYPAVSSVLVVRHGKLVYEKYYKDNNKDTYEPIYSVTKSVTSALTGIAIREKAINSVDQKLEEFFPTYYIKGIDPRKKDITIKNLLTMTAGIESTDNSYGAWTYSSDWLGYAIYLPMLNTPGERFSYNTGLAHLLSGIIAKTTKMTTNDFAKKYLFDPLGITNYHWDADPMGYYGGGSLLSLTPRDMAKFGYLYIMKGKWKGSQIIPGEWIKESLKVQSDPRNGEKYGYLWWLDNKKDTLRNNDLPVFSAMGYGGQFISIIPELDMVVVLTSDASNPENKEEATNKIIPDYIFTSVKPDNGIPNH